MAEWNYDPKKHKEFGDAIHFSMDAPEEQVLNILQSRFYTWVAENCPDWKHPEWELKKLEDPLKRWTEYAWYSVVPKRHLKKSRKPHQKGEASTAEVSDFLRVKQ